MKAEKERVRIAGLEELDAFARRLASSFAPRQILLLSGPMGAGKTELARAICRAFGADVETASPTFAIHNRYLGSRDGRPFSVDHFDLYRIESAEELEGTGFWDAFEGRGPRLAVIEWPERLDERDLPSTWGLARARLSFADESEARWVEFERAREGRV